MQNLVISPEVSNKKVTLFGDEPFQRPSCIQQKRTNSISLTSKMWVKVIDDLAIV